MSEHPLRVVSGSPLPPSFPREDFDGQIELAEPDGAEALRGALRNADIFYGGNVPDSVPAETPRLRWIQLPSAGADYMRSLPVWNSDIIITSSVGMYDVPMAEHFFAMLLALSRHIPTLVRQQDRHEWKRNWREEGLTFLELRGKTLGIVGWGKIGEEIARLARAFGMRIVGTRSSVESPRILEREALPPRSDPAPLEPLTLEPDVLYPADQLHAVLEQSDMVLSLVPLTSQTEELFGEAEFGAMTRGALFFNLGRGRVVDEDALVRALQSRRLGGAGLDVFTEEPLPSTSPLWSMEHVIVSPHVGGLGERSRDRTAHFFAVNLRRYLDGEPLLNVVDRRREY